MNKKKSRKRTNITPNKKLINIFLIIFLIAFLATVASYFTMKNKDSIKDIPTEVKVQELKKKVSLIPKMAELKEFKDQASQELFEEKFDIKEEHKFEEYTKELEQVIDEKMELEESINKENEIIQKKVEEIKEEKLKEKQKDKSTDNSKEPIKVKDKIDEKSIITNKDTFTYDKKTKPKIVILIDDVTTQAQKDKILSMGYKINMAFLPPTKTHPDSAKIAQSLSFHMIHFPMQASSAFKGEEINTLKITDSYETIEKRVKQLREWYPNAIYTNNHTGSVFTENDEAVDKLFRALKKYNFIFVDSRTSAKSVAKKYAKKYDMPYIVRNTFIDNDRDYKSIENQLKKAIEIAKRQGYAIAIGHPHNVTLEVLKDSKHLFKEVEPIFMNQLPYL
ncbi:divergent polysaccharide deacetylase family protein [Arcobacter suis]|uniref:Divergent polysaccharide deacetylase n=1 Tax=Arcobacter suis CECT 7833 TaxID=663365 RepID=A0AAD0SUF7_9BACT|nr:divergent polysaccharide deacetylase family protein [Arcobacter suis]AXX88817.1 divergent polysaccharide deacetylase [Arcobacter suis CECT 7833]